MSCDKDASSMRFGSYSYDVRRSEGLNPSQLIVPQRSIVCTVSFLDGTDKQFVLERSADGESLLNKVLVHLELVEKDFFGLQFLCISDSKEKWLDPQKSVRKQMVCPPYHLFFRVKFYVSDPRKLTEEYTRYHFFLQLRSDILEGKLRCAESSLTLLASYAVQSELGDYSAEEHGNDYLNKYVFSSEQPENLAEQVCHLHKMHRGQTPAEAEYNFLDHAMRLELYGVDLYDAQDASNVKIQLGVNSFGILVFHHGNKMSAYPWAQIMKISFKKNRFYVNIRQEDEIHEITIVFLLLSAPACKILWKSCIEHHTFFRLIAPPTIPRKGFFRIGSRFRYAGRTEFQLLDSLRERTRIERTFERPISKAHSRATYSGTVSCDTSFTPTTASPDVSHRMYRLRSGSIQRRMLVPKPRVPLSDTCEPSVDPTDRYEMAEPSLWERACLKLRTFCLGTWMQWSMLKFALGSWVPQKYGDHCGREAISSQVTMRRPRESSVPSLRRRVRETTFGVSEDESEEHSWTPAMQACTSTAAAVHHRSPSTVPASTVRKSLPNGYNNGYSNGFGSGSSYASGSNGQSNYSNGTLSRAALARASPRLSQPPLASSTNGGSPRSSVVSYASHSSIQGGSPPRARRSPQSNKSNSPVGEDSLVMVRMRPDAQGRFGFNVKGGADQNYPVIVSRVAPGSSADKSNPRLNEGDQVILINGRDVSTMAHDQVVAFIRAARGAPGGELLLTIKPNVYRLGEDVDEPETVPEPARVAESVPRSDKLSHSLRLISEALKSGRINEQFEQLYRKKPGMSMNECRQPQNMNKNRYRDVCPYDATRVVLNSAPSGDYINANFVNMEIPSSGIVNRYIACQGPLCHTTNDFWLMVWENMSPTIVMLTTTVEKGRTKCHQYWPRLYESQEYGRLVVTCLKDRDTFNCCYREFSVKDRNSKEERRVTQMQYIQWPDHGVPDDPKHFITFVEEVRRARAGSVDPIVVHCSAGIGRTGVLILMETASCLVEANEPVYPLDIVRTMRDQRAMLIQTPIQYQFVCESIIRAFNDGYIKPLSEFIKQKR